MAEVPALVVTFTSTGPGIMLYGAVAVIRVEEFTTTISADLSPKVTGEDVVKLVPVIVTWVPPIVGPLLGPTAVTVGGAANVNWSMEVAAEVPSGLVTKTSIVAAGSAGVVALIWESDTTVNAAAGVFPNNT